MEPKWCPIRGGYCTCEDRCTDEDEEGDFADEQEEDDDPSEVR